MKKSHWRHLKNGWVITGIILVVVVALVIWTRGRGSQSNFETATASVGNVLETVSVTGTVSPIGKADLAFERNGMIAKIFVKVGDPVRRGDLIAELDSAGDRAALASAQATLADLARNLTPTELAVQETALDNAKQDAINAAHNGLVKAENALFSNTDAFFTNPQGSNPSLFIRTDTYQTQLRLSQARLNVSGTFDSWASDIASATIAPTTLISKAQGYLTSIKSFMVDLALIVNSLTTNNSSMTQSAINADVAAMNNGLSTLNAAIDEVTAAQTKLATAQSAYDLKLAGNSAQSIAAQAAKVSQAQALVDQDIIDSPIDGVVTKVIPSVGEFAAAGVLGFAVQNSDFKIEARVPEADIAKIMVGNAASSTLDAYGAYVDFPAKVVSVDPAETVVEGVPTYKVTLVFTNQDVRIRSGMTANLDILTHIRTGVLTVPYRAISKDNNSESVRLVSADGKTYADVPVVTGLKGSDGLIEILSGLSEGDKVVTYVK